MRLDAERSEVEPKANVYWGLIVKTPSGFAWSTGSETRLDLVNERLDLIEMGCHPSGLFIHRFDSQLSEEAIANVIATLNRLDKILTRYIG